MPVGIMVDAAAVFLGGLAGGALGPGIPNRLKSRLTLMFGISSMAMGISYIVKVQTMPAVILAVILGVIAGELVHLEQYTEQFASFALRRAAIISPKQITDDSTNRLVSVFVLFCASGTGIFGAMESGMSGDHSILITKAILDFFTAAIFAAGLGYIVSAISVVQLFIMLVLYGCASWILPAATEIMRADFTACGGILMLAAGFRITDIRNFPIVSMLPAMVLVMPISALWLHIISGF